MNIRQFAEHAEKRENESYSPSKAILKAFRAGQSSKTKALKMRTSPKSGMSQIKRHMNNG